MQKKKELFEKMRQERRTQTILPCPPGAFCPDDPDNFPTCGCDLVGNLKGISCGNLERITGTWSGCTPAAGFCRATSATDAGSLVWLGGPEPCVDLSCGWFNVIIKGTVRFSNVELDDQDHMAGIFFRGREVFQATNEDVGALNRLGYHGYMLTISPVTKLVELFHFRGDNSVVSVPPDVPFVTRLTGEVTQNQDISFEIQTFFEDLRIRIQGQEPIDFIGVLADTDLFFGSVGLFASRQVAEFRSTTVQNTISPCFVPCDAGTYQPLEAQTDASSCIPCSEENPPPVLPGEYPLCDEPNSDSGVWYCDFGYYCPGVEPWVIPCPIGTKGTMFGAATEEEGCEPCVPGDTKCHIPSIQHFNVFPSEPGFYSEGVFEVDELEECVCYLGSHSCGNTFVTSPSSNSWQASFPPDDAEPNDRGVTSLVISQKARDPINQHIWWGSRKVPTSPRCNSDTCDWTDITIRTNFVIFDPELASDPRQTFTAFFRLNRAPEVPAGYGLLMNPVLNQLEIRKFPWEGPPIILATLNNFALPYTEFRKLAIEVIGNQFNVMIDETLVISAVDVDNTFPTGSVGFKTTAGFGLGMHDLTIQMNKETNTYLPCATARNSEQPCPPGTFQEEFRQASCLPCPPGFYGCSAFGSGYRPLNTVLVCDAGYSCAGGAEPRIACPAGTYSKAQEVSCTPCATGTFASEVATPGACFDCPAQHVDINNSTECKTCTPDMFSYSELSNCEGASGKIRYNFTSFDTECQRLVNFGGNETGILQLECVAISLNSNIGVQYVSIAMVGIFINLCILACWVWFWKNPLVKASQRELSLGIILGAIGMTFTTLIELGQRTDVSCQVGSVLPVIAMTFTLGCLVAKLRRAYTVFVVQLKKLKRHKSTMREALMPIVLVMLVQLVIIIIWLVLDTPVAVNGSTEVENIKRFCADDSCRPPLQKVCGRNEEFPVHMGYVGHGWLGLILFYCCILAWQTRNLTSVFAEAKLVAVTVYTIATIAAFLLVVVSLPDTLSILSQRLIWVMGISWISMIVLVGLFAPKIYIMLRYDKSEVSKMVQQVARIIATSRNSETRMNGTNGSSAWGSLNYASSNTIDKAESTDKSAEGGNSPPESNTTRKGLFNKVKSGKQIGKLPSRRTITFSSVEELI